MSCFDNFNSKSKNIHLDLRDKAMKVEDLESYSIKSELKSIHEQIDLLEEKLSYGKSSSQFSSSMNNISDFLKHIDRTEKKIEIIESTMKKTPASKIQPRLSKLLDYIQASLIQERQNNYLLRQENEKLKKKLRYKKNYTKDLNTLREDYESLIESIKRSQNIRAKQKKLISSLKTKIPSQENSPKSKTIKYKKTLNKYYS